jgi:hypothetical protein
MLAFSGDFRSGNVVDYTTSDRRLAHLGRYARHLADESIKPPTSR